MSSWLKKFYSRQTKVPNTQEIFPSWLAKVSSLLKNFFSRLENFSAHWQNISSDWKRSLCDWKTSSILTHSEKYPKLLEKFPNSLKIFPADWNLSPLAKYSRCLIEVSDRLPQACRLKILKTIGNMKTHKVIK